MAKFIKIKEIGGGEFSFSIEKVVSVSYYPDAEKAGWKCFCYLHLVDTPSKHISKENYDIIVSALEYCEQTAKSDK